MLIGVIVSIVFCFHLSNVQAPSALLLSIGLEIRLIIIKRRKSASKLTGTIFHQLFSFTESTTHPFLL